MISTKEKVLAIIGQGYVGLPLAMAAVKSGWRVIGIDSLESKVRQINSGSSPVEDISDELLRDSLIQGNYLATTDYSQVSFASVIAICVPTPLDKKREPDLEMLTMASVGIAPHLAEGSLIVSESTSYPGTLRNLIIPKIESLRSRSCNELFFASAPERVNPGDLNWTQRNTPRLVGGINSESTYRALNFYKEICDNVVKVSTPEIAEAAKLLENTFRLVNIALVNEFAQLCSTASINVYEVIEAAASKPYGFMRFNPGIGVGGHCIPVDPMYLTWWAKQNGIEASLVEKAAQVNVSMPKYVAKRVSELLGVDVRQPKVLIVGVAYKSGLGDTRETPASDLYDELSKLGFEVSWHDPLVENWKGSKSSSLESVFQVAIIATAHPEIDLSRLLKSDAIILDCTNSLTTTSKVIAL